MENQLYIALQSNKLFLDIDIQEVDLSDIKGELKPLKEGEILYREEHPADKIYLVISGEVNLLKKKLLGSTKSFIFGENDFFGYDEIAEETSRTSTAVALRDSYLIAFSKDEVNALIDQNHMIKTNLLNYSDIEPQGEQEYTEDEVYPGFESEHESPQFKDKKTDVTSFEQSLKDDLIDKHDSKIDEEASLYEEEIDETYDKLHVPEEKSDYNLKEKEDKADEPLFPEEEESLDDYVSDNDETFSELSSLDDRKVNETEDKPKKPKYTDFDEAFLEAFHNEEKKDKPTTETSTEPENFSFDEDKPVEQDEFISENEEVSQTEDFKLEEETHSDSFDKDYNENILPEEKISYSKSTFEDKIENGSPAKTHDSSFTSNTKLQSDQLKKIIKALQLVNSNIKIDDVLQNIVNVATELTQADRGTLYLIDRERNELWSKIAMGSETKEIRLSIGEGVAGWVAQNRQTVNIEDVAQDQRFKSDVDRSSGYQTKSMLCFPLKDREDNVVGVIQLLNSKNGHFTEKDEEFLNAISIQCSLALQNAEMLEKFLQGERVQSLGKMTNFLIQDIKKPVLVSKRYAEHLKSKELNKDAAQIVEMILEQLTQVADLVQTTASYSEGKAVLRTSRISLNETLTEFADRLNSYVKSRNCNISNEFDKDVKVQMDVKEFFQCYNHIVRNACDAMPEGGKIHIATKFSKDKNAVVISIKDEGLGIPDSLVDKLFEPFMTHGKKEGTGLGLTITKKIVESHSGTINVVSNLGEGATFNIALPISSSL
ncbi:MAG: GAF domain-containing protein [Melioribacteraceae bacterium]|nr:GAF domain-containing protein [Melioribacteraceae bacterium]